MMNEENTNVTNQENNMTIDAFGNYVAAPQSTSTNNEKKPVDKKLLMIIGGVVAALAVLIIILNMVGGGSAKGIAQKYANAYKNLDAKAIVNLLPDDFVKASKEEDMDLEEELQDVFDALKDQDIKITKAEVDDGKELTKEDIEDVDYIFEMYGMDVKEVSAAVIFEITLEAEKDGETRDGDETITVVKYKGSWALIPEDIS